MNTAKAAPANRRRVERCAPCMIVVAPGKAPETVALGSTPLDLDMLQATIGGYVTIGARLDLGGGRWLDVWAHDEALLTGDAWNASIDGADPLAGVLVIAVGDSEGETHPIASVHEYAMARAWIDCTWRRCVATPSRRGGAL